MKYEIIKIKPISRFSINFINKKQGKKIKDINLSAIFWKRILKKEFLNNFLKKINNKKNQDSINFLLKKINIIKEKINCVNKTIIPNGNDIFFSFRIFSLILFYINNYFKKDNISIGLREGIMFHKDMNSVNDLIKNIKYYKNTNFFKKLITPLIKKTIKKDGYFIYKFDIFWPAELLLVGIIGSKIKEINSKSKIVVDLSYGNEQFDFNQWIKLLTKENKNLFKYYDFFIIKKDFGLSLLKIKNLLEGKINNNIENIIFFDKKIYFAQIKNKNLNKDIFKNFIKETFSATSINKIFNKKDIYARFLPYKCYWSNCNFCAINSQNIFSYNKKYSYTFFINKWIDFIKNNNIQSINFKDEAIPPKVILLFAKKIIKNNLKINYQFRTRFEKLYTYNNCKILAKSGCRFCGIGLESAIDSVNEQIANKGNKGITLRDKIKIIHNFDKAGIAIHNYAIMGFPGETKKEIAITYTFLKNNIINSNYYTCTPNIFGLMKGTNFFEKKEIYGIEIKKKDLNNPFKLIYNFKYNGKSRDIKFLKKLEENIHKIQFLPWLKKDSLINGRAFWNYIDRSYIFYLMKRFHNTNPFYKYKNINNPLFKKNFNYWLKKEFDISNYFQLFKSNNYIYVYDWVCCKEIKLNKIYKKFLLNYNTNLLLGENIKNNLLEKRKDLKDTIYLLLKVRILLFKN